MTLKKPNRKRHKGYTPWKKKLEDKRETLITLVARFLDKNGPSSRKEISVNLGLEMWQVSMVVSHTRRFDWRLREGEKLFSVRR